MKKRVSALVLALIIAVTAVGAVNIEEIMPYASAYLDAYSVSLGAKGNGKMSVGMTVDGITTMDRIGVSCVDIDEKINGTWYDFDEQYSSDNTDFMTTDSRDYLGSYTFYGTPGRQYRVTITAYARKDGGYDTGEVTSPVVTCE
ncbi:MAG: hypothetical protein IJ042_03155 [Butyricicoccus sp.]|nr:hypothetical protein [Butyricicoccus sp.]